MLALSSPWRFESSLIKLKALVPKDEVRLGFDLFNEIKIFRMCPTHSRFGLSIQTTCCARLHSVRISFRRSFRSVSSSRATSGDSRVRAYSLAPSFRFPLSQHACLHCGAEPFLIFSLRARGRQFALTWLAFFAVASDNQTGQNRANFQNRPPLGLLH